MLVSGTGSTDNGSFIITGNTLSTSVIFDYESKTSYSIRVRSTDTGGLSYEKALIISVNDLIENTAPTNISLSASSLNENNAAGASIGTLSSTDAEVNDTFTYTLVSGTGNTDNGSFTITGNTLNTSVVFDYESKTSYSIRVRSTDAGGLSYEKAFTIGVNNVNENPTNISLSASSLNENNAAGASIGTLSSTDADVNDTFSYTLVSGTGSTDNGSFAFAGNTLSTSVVFDYESKTSYSIRVRSTDAGGLSYEKVFIIAVNNVNEAPTNFSISSTNIYELNTIGATIGTLGSSDADVGDSFKYTMVQGNAINFSIIGNTLIATSVLNYADAATYKIRIKTTDLGGLSFEKDILINISPKPSLTGTGNDIGSTQVLAYNSNPAISKGYSSRLSVNGDNIVSYSWSPSAGLSNANSSNPVAKPAQTTTYTVTVTNSQGSTTTASITVTVREDYNILPNNILTPNGDGVNDNWVVENLNTYPQAEVKIFDKAGRLVYKKSGYNNDWNAQYNGYGLSSDVYYYIINFGSGLSPKKGFITVIR